MEFFIDELRQAIYKILDNMTENLFNVKDKLKPEEFNSAKRQTIDMTHTTQDFLLEIQNKLFKFTKEVEEDIPNLGELRMNMQAIVGQMNPKTANQTAKSLLDNYNNLCEMNKTLITSIKDAKLDSLGIVPVPIPDPKKDKSPQVPDSLVVLDPKSPKSIRVDFKFRKESSDLNEYQFIDYAMEAWKRVLDRDTQPTSQEYLMINLAYKILRRSPGGTSLSRRSRFMGVPGFHSHTQTYMSLTDPGPGHLYGTITKKRWMEKGVIVHLEHLERTTIEQENEPTRDEIESYRIPSIKWFLMTRLHNGDIAPQTLYIGRRLKDSDNFDNDMLRVSRIFSACLNNMFNSGTSECKLSMEYLSTYETIKHMRSIRAEVTRNPYQILSAAWNLNRKLKDDYPLAKLKSGFMHKYENIQRLKISRDVTTIKEKIDRFEIAKMAIAYTKLGGFDKVTWDGASDTYPSRCIVPYQLTLPQLFELNHIAHSLGLITYVSAGFKLPEIKLTVFSGVDGVGIGGAQVLRLMDHTTKVHGAYQQERIDGILETRDQAANSLYGKCVNLMCRLDSMYYEGSLSPQEKQHRDNLFRYLNDRYSRIEVFDDKLSPEYQNMLFEDNPDMRNILNTLSDITKLNTTMNSESDRTIYLDRFKRILRNFDTALIRTTFSSDTDPQLIRSEIQKIVDSKSERGAYDYWVSYPWIDIIDTYHFKLLKEFINTF